MNKQLWREGRYGFWNFQAGRFSGTVGWDKGGYSATFEGHTVQERFLNIDQAKQACEQLAKRLLEQALAEVLAKMNL